MVNVSIVIPAYSMHNDGVHLLNVLLNSVYRQTYKDFEVIISDHSEDNVIENFCRNYGKVVYVRNTGKRGSSSANVNNAIRHAKGNYIKPLFQDDFFKKDYALTMFMDKMKTHNWCACGSDQYDYDMTKPFRGRYPVINADLRQMALGENYYGGPSCICYKKNSAINFDENIIWLMDCELYWNLHKAYGNPGLINDLLITTRYCEKNVSNTLATKELRQKEYEYVSKKIS
ncbi:MAG: glycosyltransferase family 2 protein [Candidatus Nanoarchaeia archaeon]|nr:glycosyltransferase family 2 protein [Candidatus Nanoarchaeia archaeon]